MQKLQKQIGLTVLIVLVAGLFITAAAQQPLNYYLPKNISYNNDIPTPSEVLGYQVGKWHVSHDQLLMYMRAVAEASDRVTIREYAKSHEDRPLVVLTITSPSNHSNLGKYKAAHAELSDPVKSDDIDIDNIPVVVYQGYSIHGNESSGSNAALLYAYYLAAAEGAQIEKRLEECIVLLDPCFNPDGLNRFAQWANGNKSVNPNADPYDREHNESWPSGRTNHYWFDLNRDWLPTVHPESKGRIQTFHEWKPNVLTDHHEMGTNSTYFFQPGVPSRTNPNTPLENQELTGKIAEFHAEALDKIGAGYYTRESFDDFYYGKGSTYPDANGCVGILFEQASSRGHVQSSTNGTLTFPFTIRNQFLTSVSTLEASYNLRKELLTYQREFYKNSLNDAKSDKTKAYVFGDPHDASRRAELVNLLKSHHIKVYGLADDVSVNGNSYKKGEAVVVPMDQKQYRLIKAVFEKRTEFTDSLFYDVSAFTLPLAYNLQYDALEGKSFKTSLLGKLAGGPMPEFAVAPFQKNTVAYLMEWSSYYAPRALNQLLSVGVNVKVAHKPFTATVDGTPQEFPIGTIYISVQNQSQSGLGLHASLTRIAKQNNVGVYATNTHMTPQGIDLGSPSLRRVRRPKTLLITGEGARSYDAGEVWHLLDNRFGMSVTMVEGSRLSYVDLDRYNTIVMVDGSYSGFTKSANDALVNWVRNGGTLIAIKGAVKWASRNKLAQVSYKKMERQPDSTSTGAQPYANLSNDRGSRVIGGAIFETEADLTHPLMYGYYNATIPIFKKGTMCFKPTKNVYAAPLMYTAEPLTAGYVWENHLPEIASTPSVIVSGAGSGRVICFADSPNFRGFWYGTNKMFLNALFFGNQISRSSIERVVSKKEKPKEQKEEGEHHH